MPSVVLKHAPDTCKIYVVSATKIISNSVNPASTTGMLIIRCLHYLIYFATLTCVFETLTSHSFTNSSSSESKYKNYLSDVRHLRSDSQTSTLSSVNSDAAEETFHQSLEESRSDMSRNNGFLPISSTRSEQVITLKPCYMYSYFIRESLSSSRTCSFYLKKLSLLLNGHTYLCSAARH